MKNITVYGQHEWDVVEQLLRCVRSVPDSRGVLCGDAHYGYSMPIGGVVKYQGYISPSAVGFDIGCGNAAWRTSIQFTAINSRLYPTPAYFEDMSNKISRYISFGLARVNETPVTNSNVLEEIRESNIPFVRSLYDLATSQLGTVGSGNHYVDLMVDDENYIWIACHFGSRGFGHKIASYFLNAATNGAFNDKDSNAPPVIMSDTSDLGQQYIDAMRLALRYAYAGREYVMQTVCALLGETNDGITIKVANHHNFADEVDGSWIIRKGATRITPGRYSFIGGSMGSNSAIVTAKHDADLDSCLSSAPHGAGRLMSRAAAKNGRKLFVCGSCGHQEKNKGRGVQICSCGQIMVLTQITEPIQYNTVLDDLYVKQGIIVKGGDADEAPAAYRTLESVLSLHNDTVDVVKWLRPIVVVMSPKDVKDPYKD